MPGCRNNDDSGLTDNSDDPAVDAPRGRISGFVSDGDGVPVQDVTVTSTGRFATTDEDGLYVLEHVYPSDNIVVEFLKKGFAKNYTVVAIDSWETVSSNATLLRVDGTGTFSGEVGGVIDVDDVRLSFSEGSIVDAEGKTYKENVTAEVTYVNPHVGILGTPGDLSAIVFSEGSDDEVTTTQLVSYGMVDVTLYSEDYELLALADDSVAKVRIPVFNGSFTGNDVIFDGDDQALWSFSPHHGKWIEEGVGAVISNNGQLFFDFEASHFSWWNCDQGFVPTCAEGRVRDVIGFPVKGAEVRCDGGQTTSIVTTDSDGYYSCSVMAGDSVLLTGATTVGNALWSATSGAHFIDGSTSSAQDCQPLPDLQIDVCRIAGAVTVENINSSIGDGGMADADHFSAIFWDPPGDVVFCNDPWDSLVEDSCWVGTSDEVAGQFPAGSVPGIPDDSKSVGAWLEIDNGNNQYRVNREYVDGRPYYNWNSHEDNGMEIVTERPSFSENDTLDVFASGDSSSYFGEWNEEGVLTVPVQVEFSDRSSVSWGSGGLSMRYDGAGSDEHVFFMGSFEGDSQMMCKFSDDGNLVLQSSDSYDLPSGWGGLGLYHLGVTVTAGPDGLPIWLQTFSGETLSVQVVR
tara:strand:- start:420 stop:2306 length:1887 start_codon:yes stop_codon:yes gene_type:complete